jgi:hypothetical protein
VADVGCGHGASTILLAQAYPEASILGSDYHQASIDTARKRVADAGMACTLAITGEPGELVTAAAQHAVAGHGHADTPELREQLRSVLAEEPATSAPGAFVQLIEFDTDRIGEWEAIGDRWAAAIGTQRAVRWSLLGADRGRPGRYLAVVEFPGYAEAMANSGHPATAAFLKELQSICRTEPEFRNLDVRSVRAY